MKKWQILLVVIAVFGLAVMLGCQPKAERITKEQWNERYKPETLEQGQAMAVLNSAKIKAESEAKTLAIMNKFKIACAIGFVGSIVALGIGLWLRMKLVVGLGIVGAMACLAGYGLACADIVYGKYVAVGGLIFGVVIGGMTIFVLVRAFREVVAGGEEYKRRMAGFEDCRIANFENAHREAQKHNSTKKLVKKTAKKVKAKL